MPDTKQWTGRSRKVMSHNLDKNVGRESDGRVLPTKCPNKGGSSTPAEGMEERRPTKENTGQTAASQIQSWENALAGLQRVRAAAKREKRLRFTALLHHVSDVLLSNSFYALKRGAAPGVDGLTWQEYETDLDKRLEDLHSRVHRGTYRALPSKRAYILKQDEPCALTSARTDPRGGRRATGVPTAITLQFAIGCPELILFLKHGC